MAGVFCTKDFELIWPVYFAPKKLEPNLHLASMTKMLIQASHITQALAKIRAAFAVARYRKWRCKCQRRGSAFALHVSSGKRTVLDSPCVEDLLDSHVMVCSRVAVD